MAEADPVHIWLAQEHGDVEFALGEHRIRVVTEDDPEVSLPERPGGGPEPPIRIKLTPDGSLLMDGSGTEVDALRSALNEGRTVVLHVSRSA